MKLSFTKKNKFMKIEFNGKVVANSILALRKKIKKVGSGVTNGSVVELVFPKGTRTKLKVITKSFDTKKVKGLTKVNFANV